jgi:hypothetical protein
MRRDEGIHDGSPVGKRTLQDEMVDDVDEIGFIKGLTAVACQRLVKLPREPLGIGELDQLALQLTAMIQQARCLGRRGGGSNGRRSRYADRSAWRLAAGTKRSRCQSNPDITPCKSAKAGTRAGLRPSTRPRKNSSPSDATEGGIR